MTENHAALATVDEGLIVDLARLAACAQTLDGFDAVLRAGHPVHIVEITRIIQTADEIAEAHSLLDDFDHFSRAVIGHAARLISEHYAPDYLSDNLVILRDLATSLLRQNATATNP